MAASLSRPDPSSPASVAEASFSTARRGFQQDEVRAFLVAVGAELGRLQERERQLEAELRDAVAAAEATPSNLDEATVTELLGEETVRVLQTARESASQIKVRAEETAARILREANDEVNRLRQETEIDVARRRQEAAADAEAEVALAKQQGREMVNEARAYRERVLADLDRRTTLARKQIEELIHGRDRLLQVFERARLVAVDVTSELRDLDTPDELVNLTPTTGPVPLMVPNQRRARPTEQVEPAGARPGVAAQPGEAATSDDVPDEQLGADRAQGGGADASPDAAAHHPIETDRADEATADESMDDEATSDAATDETADETADESGDDITDRHVADADDQAALVDDGAVDDGTDENGEGDDGLVVADEDQAEEPTVAAPARDDNVVALFRDRAVVPAATADDRSTERTSPDEVGGIFARLRDELPSTDTVVRSTADADETAEVDADEVTAEDTPFTRRDEALVPLIVGAARKIKRVLADEQNVVLDRLRQKEPVRVLADLVPGLDEHTATYRTAIDDELVAAAAAGAVEVGTKDTRTLRNRLGRAGALDDAATLIRTALIGPLRDRLERSISDGAGDNEAITKRVRAVYREWKTQHIDGQLDDVFRFAHGGGVAVVVEPGTPMIWTIDPTEPACPDCEDNSLSGAVPAGEPFPTGHAAAPAHPGCRCLVLPAD